MITFAHNNNDYNRKVNQFSWKLQISNIAKSNKFADTLGSPVA